MFFGYSRPPNPLDNSIGFKFWPATYLADLLGHTHGCDLEEQLPM